MGTLFTMNALGLLDDEPRVKASDMQLYAVTDSRWLKEGETLAGQVEKAIRGGVSFVQLREKEADDETFIRLAREVRAVCKMYKVPFVINDRVDIAKAVDADGVHVGQDDESAKQAREELGPEKIVGVSCKTVEQALKAQRDGADYIGAGAMFTTGTKGDAKNISYERLQTICRATNLPVVAIGGISLDNVETLADSGISGIAVVSAIFAQDDPQAAAEELKRKVLQIV